MRTAIKYLLLPAFLVVGAARADYPERSVKLIVPYAPAGVSDGLARILAEGMAKELGQPVVIENKPGANTRIATQMVARARPDGYTLLLSSSASMVLNPLLYKKVGYSPVGDFRQLAILAEVPLVVVTNPQSKVATLTEFAQAAKAQNGRWNYASVGLGNPLQLTTEMLKSELAIDLAHVPYNGSAPALASLLANETQLMVDVLATSLPHIRAGKLQALAVTSDRRNKLLPQVPTVAESGYPEFRAATWFGIAAPSGTPPAVLTKLQMVVANASSSAAIAAWADVQGLVLQPPRSDVELLRYIERDRSSWEKTIRARNIVLED